jgi:hypothetical protein
MDRATGGGATWWTRHQTRNLEQSLAHPWRRSLSFGIAYFAGIMIATVMIHFDQAPRSALLGPAIQYAITCSIFSVIMGLSLRGGWLRRRYQRRLDRLHALMTAPPTGWYPDPAGRHEYRFWTGQRWSDFSLDNGVQCADPLPEP